MKACIILADQFEELEAIGIIALLRRGGLELDVFRITDHNPTGVYGVTIDKTRALETIDYKEYGLVVLPGGAGYQQLRDHSKVKDLLKSFYEDKKWIAAICAAPTILGSLGMLQGKAYTCFPGMQKDEYLGQYQEDKAVVDGLIITGKAAGAVTDFSLLILANLLGKEVADEVKKSIYY